MCHVHNSHGRPAHPLTGKERERNKCRSLCRKSNKALFQKWKSKTWGIMARSLNALRKPWVISCGAEKEQIRRRLRGDLITISNFLVRARGRADNDLFSLGTTGGTQRKCICARGGWGWIWGEGSAPRGWLCTGTGSPEQQWSRHQTWESSRRFWMLWGSGCGSWEKSCAGLRVGVDDPCGVLPTQVVLWFSDFALGFFHCSVTVQNTKPPPCAGSLAAA